MPQNEDTNEGILPSDKELEIFEKRLRNENYATDCPEIYQVAVSLTAYSVKKV